MPQIVRLNKYQKLEAILPKDLWEIILKISQTELVKISDIIEQAIRDWIVKYEKDKFEHIQAGGQNKDFKTSLKSYR